MKKLLTWIGRIFAFLFSLLALIAVGIGIWVLFQPSTDNASNKLNEEYLLSDEYRALADSSLKNAQELSQQM